MTDGEIHSRFQEFYCKRFGRVMTRIRILVCNCGWEGFASELIAISNNRNAFWNCPLCSKTHESLRDGIFVMGADHFIDSRFGMVPMWAEA